MKPSSHAFLIAIFLFGCATGSTLTRKDVLVQYDQVAALSSGVKDAAGRDARLLAPQGFERAQELLDEAVEHAQSADKQRTEQAAKRGLEVLAQVNRSIALAQDELQEVLTTRQRAHNEGAASLLKEGFASADERLKEAALLLEANKLEGPTWTTLAAWRQPGNWCWRGPF